MKTRNDHANDAKEFYPLNQTILAANKHNFELHVGNTLSVLTFKVLDNPYQFFNHYHLSVTAQNITVSCHLTLAQGDFIMEKLRSNNNDNVLEYLDSLGAHTAECTNLMRGEEGMKENKIIIQSMQI